MKYRRKRRYVIVHRNRPEFRMMRERYPPLLEEHVRRGLLRGLYPVLLDAVFPRGLDNLRILRVEHHFPHTLNEPVVGQFGGLFYPVRVIEQRADEPYPAGAGMGAGIGLSRLGSRITEYALLALPGVPVVIRLLVRARAHAESPRVAYVLVYKNYAVFAPLVKGA